MFYHFDYRYKTLYAKSHATERSYASRLDLFQSQTFNKIWNVWKVHDEAAFGCPMTWMSHALIVSTNYSELLYIYITNSLERMAASLTISNQYFVCAIR
jgi:hypothetical protein